MKRVRGRDRPRLAGRGVEVEIFTRAGASDLPGTVELAPGVGTASATSPLGAIGSFHLRATLMRRQPTRTLSGCARAAADVPETPVMQWIYVGTRPAGSPAQADSSPAGKSAQLRRQLLCGP